MVGKVRFHYFYTPNGGYTIPITQSTDVVPTHRYKIVVISGEIATGMKRAGINPLNYQQISDYLGLQ